MTIDEAIKRFNDKAKHELTLGNLQGCLEFRQLAEWLEKYQKIEQIIEDRDAEIIPEDYDNWYIENIKKVVKDGKND